MSPNTIRKGLEELAARDENPQAPVGTGLRPKAQYGLQGWKRHKVYPDFVFGFMMQGNTSSVVLLETKGAHLAGNNDTGYKQALLAQLTDAYCDGRFRSAGELSLEDGGQAGLACDLVFDTAWQSTMDSRHFSGPN